MIFLGVSKGRILNLVSLFLFKRKIFFNINSRKMIIKTNIKKFNIIPIKYMDIEFYLNKGFIDACILGSDIYLEYFNKNYSSLKLSIFQCRISIITNKSSNLFSYYNSNRKVIIYTKYFNMLKNYFSYSNRFVIKKLSGTLELSLCLGVSTYIADIIDTGETLIKNNLFEVEVIKTISSIILFKKKIENKKFKFINNFFK